MIRWKNIHSVSMGTDPPEQATTQQFFLYPPPPPTEESQQVPRERQEALIITIAVLHMFSNTNTDFKTVYQHVLIPSYVIRVI